jgi:hypothetical protein
VTDWRDFHPSSFLSMMMRTPVALPKEVEIELYHVMGGIIIRFGFIDALTADICRILFEDLGGHSSQKKPPRPLSVRLEYIGRCFRNKPELAAMKDDVEILAKAIKEIDFLRNFLVHGCLTGYYGHTYQFTKLDGREDFSGYDQNSMMLAHDKLAELAQACTHAVRGLTEIGRKLNQVAP